MSDAQQIVVKNVFVFRTNCLLFKEIIIVNAYLGETMQIQNGKTMTYQHDKKCLNFYTV